MSIFWETVPAKTSAIERTKGKSWRYRFIHHAQAIDVCLAVWPINPETVYALTMTPPVIPQSEDTP